MYIAEQVGRFLEPSNFPDRVLATFLCRMSPISCVLVEVVVARVFPTVTLAQAGEFVECSRVLLSASVIVIFVVLGSVQGSK